ncbi:MAG TPA: phytoene/squalene synthase family protein, partial [Isosphaeraceae bacterium]
MNAGLRSSYQFCGDVARRQARNFYYSFLLLPADRRRAMCALYAFLRHTDDLADEPGPVAAKRRALDAWRSELDAALGGAGASWPGLPALADTVARHGVPARHLHEVLDGVAMDLEPVAYPTFADLYAYCYRVASAVGLCCIRIWGYRSEGGRAEALAEACGVALQLTNILRDVREDARLGRIYLPREDLDRFGVAAADLDAPRPSDAVRALLAFQGQRA